MGSMSAVAVKARETRQYKPCSVTAFIRTLTEEERNEFLDLLSDTDVFSTTLTHAVNDEYGVSLSVQQVGRHRRKECACR